jgi:Reverse transcriptase (RNA-dependent DNA polymerase)
MLTKQHQIWGFFARFLTTTGYGYCYTSAEIGYWEVSPPRYYTLSSMSRLQKSLWYFGPWTNFAHFRAIYGVGLQIWILLDNLWQQLELVPRWSGYYGRSTKVKCGVTQGDIVPPINFNIVVYALVCHWRITAPASSVHALFYADNSWLASSDAVALQSSLDCLTNLFQRAGLEMNAVMTKTLLIVITVLHLQDYVLLLSPANSMAVWGRGTLHQQYGSTLQEQNLSKHLLRVHGVCSRTAKRQKVLDEAQRDPVLYCVSVPCCVVVPCLVHLCKGISSAHDQMHSHFVYRHPRDILCSEEMVTDPLPMQTTWHICTTFGYD